MDSSKGAEEGLGGGAGEVMRINVVYFLSRGGRADHPHLFRVNHRSRAGGVRLRDVKRWLAEIRGKDMPGNFSWSYKRKYKAGYVWQDLKDDDLITPVSDNEYVLKGCQLRGTPPRGIQQAPKTTPSSFSLDEKGQSDDNDKEEKKKTCSQRTRTDRTVEVVLAPDDDESTSKSPDDDESTSKSPDDDGEDLPARRRSTVRFKIEVSRPQDLRHRRREPEAKAVTGGAAVASWPAPEKQGLGAGGARRMRAARALHNILTCGTVDADDAALRPVARGIVAEAAGGDDWTTPTPTCPGVGGCGLRVSRKARSRRGGKEQQGRRDGGKRHGGDAGSKKRHGGDANKPAALPRCSQCGKEFKPQELHSHMQSCRGFRERMKSSTADRSRRNKSDHCSEQQPCSDSAVLLLTGS